MCNSIPGAMGSRIARRILLMAFAQLLLVTLLLSSENRNNHVAAQIHNIESHDGMSLINDSLLNPEVFSNEDAPRCEPMQISFCERVYNQTMLPNALGHVNQAEVESDINVYDPLVKANCSPDLRLFLCAVYAPICFDHGHESQLKLQPCQSLCESARRGCTVHLRKLLLDWPEPLRCEKFPDGRQGNLLCVGNDSHSLEGSESNDMPIRDLGFVCPRNFEAESHKFYLNGRRYDNCATPCEGVYLNHDDTQIVRIAVGFIAIVCLLSSLFTCATFLIDTKRFEYPARPIIIIAFCQLVVATCFLVGFSTNNRIACNEPLAPPRNLPNMKMIRSTAMGNKKGSCTLLFMTMYFFQLSTVMWWLMMTISWYMIAKLKWAPEAVNSMARYFHFSSWALPALFTICMSVLGDIGGDPLSGTCFISTATEDSMRAFLLIPVTICLILGCLFFATGFKSIWETREMLRLKYGEQTGEHFKLVTRIGLYSLLFITFNFISLYTHFYELSHQTTWKMAWLSNICKVRDYSIPCPTKNYSHLGPHYAFFIIKYAATMAIGTISALFMVSQKTVKAYREMTILYDYKPEGN